MKDLNLISLSDLYFSRYSISLLPVKEYSDKILINSSNISKANTISDGGNKSVYISPYRKESSKLYMVVYNIEHSIVTESDINKLVVRKMKLEGLKRVIVMSDYKDAYILKTYVKIKDMEIILDEIHTGGYIIELELN